MTEEQNKPKTTLIKHAKGPVAPTAPVEETKEPETARTFEKKKVVVVKKKVVVVRPQVRQVEPASHTPDSDKEQKTQTVSVPSSSPSTTPSSSDPTSVNSAQKQEHHFKRTPNKIGRASCRERV